MSSTTSLKKVSKRVLELEVSNHKTIEQVIKETEQKIKLALEGKEYSDEKRKDSVLMVNHGQRRESIECPVILPQFANSDQRKSLLPGAIANEIKKNRIIEIEETESHENSKNRSSSSSLSKQSCSSSNGSSMTSTESQKRNKCVKSHPVTSSSSSSVDKEEVVDPKKLKNLIYCMRRNSDDNVDDKERRQSVIINQVAVMQMNIRR